MSYRTSQLRAFWHFQVLWILYSWRQKGNTVKSTNICCIQAAKIALFTEIAVRHKSMWFVLAYSSLFGPIIEKASITMWHMFHLVFKAGGWRILDKVHEINLPTPEILFYSHLVFCSIRESTICIFYVLLFKERKQTLWWTCWSLSWRRDS